MIGNHQNASNAQKLGTVLSTIHRDTYQRQEYQEAIAQKQHHPKNSIVKRLVTSLEKITPEIFGAVPDDGLKFYALYQRYDSLGQSLAELSDAFTADCLTHNDLKLNNILLHNDWELPESGIVRLIDWERSAWGDPAFDLGTLVGSYLQIWLNSLVVSKSRSIEESWSLAMVPLDRVQPSIAALTRSHILHQYKRTSKSGDLRVPTSGVLMRGFPPHKKTSRRGTPTG